MKQIVLIEVMGSFPRSVQWVVRALLWLAVFPILAALEAVKGLGIVLHDSGEWICSTGVYNDWLKMWWKLRKQF